MLGRTFPKVRCLLARRMQGTPSAPHEVPPTSRSNHTASPPNGPYTSSTYTRRPSQTPNTQSPDAEDHYILTLRVDEAHQSTIAAIRARYFPPHLNKISAHVTLFHALPGSRLATIEDDIDYLCTKAKAFEIEIKKPFLLGKGGVGLRVAAPEAKRIHTHLKGEWKKFLSKQDNGGFKPHYTVQNKVEPEVAKATLETLEKEVEDMQGLVDGLTLWRYDKGYWKDKKDFVFKSKLEHKV